MGGMFISTPSANFPLIMSLITANFGGFTKKTTLNAMVRSIVKEALQSLTWDRCLSFIVQETLLAHSSSLRGKLLITSPDFSRLLSACL